MLNQSTTFGCLPGASSALLQGFPNNTGLVRTLLPGHPNVSLGLEVRQSSVFITGTSIYQLIFYRQATAHFFLHYMTALIPFCI